MRKKIDKIISVSVIIAMMITSFPMKSFAEEYSSADEMNVADDWSDNTQITEDEVFTEDVVDEEEIEVSELEEEVDFADDEAEEMPVNGVSGTVYADGSCGTSTIWEIYKDGDEYTLVISGSGEVTSVAWADYKSQITSVVVEDGVTVLPKMAFSRCYKLADVVLSENLSNIPKSAFGECSNLKRIIIPDNVVSIDGGAFAKTALEDISIPYTCTTLDHTGWSETTSDPFNYINWGDVVTVKITKGKVTASMPKYSFPTGLPWKRASLAGKKVLVTIDNGVKYIPDSMFGYSKIEEIFIPESVVAIGDNAFSECNSLESVSGAKGVTTFGTSIFGYCTNLKNVNLDSFVSIPDKTFLECTAIEEICLPNTVVSIGKEAFKNCSSLSTLKMPIDAVIADETSFAGDTAIKSITLTPGKTGNRRYDYTIQTKNYTPWYISRNSLSEIILDGKFNSIGDYTFSGISNVTTLDIPLTVRTIGSNAFANCTSISFNFAPDHRFTQVGKDAFKNCAKAQNIYFVNSYIGDSVYSINTCSIGDSANTIPDCFTIYGLEGSTSQTYAKKYNKTFVVYECPESEHKWGKRTYPATDEEDGYYYDFCRICEKRVETGEIIKKIDKNSISLNQVEYYYDGYEKTPAFIVKDSEGIDIPSSNYDVDYQDNVNAGTATAILTFKNEYSGYYTKEFEIKKGKLKKNNNPTVTSIEYGQPLGYAYASEGEFVNSKNEVIYGYYQWKDDIIIPDVNDSESTEYELSFIPYDYYYEPYEFKSTVKVNKCPTCVINAPLISEITYGQSLEDAAISNGSAGIGNSTVLDGSFAWKDGTIHPDASVKKSQEYTVVFSPADSDRYSTCEIEMYVPVNQATPSLNEVPLASELLQGSSLSDSILSGGKIIGVDGVSEISGKYTWSDGGAMPSLNDSEKTDFAVVFTPDDLNYCAIEIPVKVKVNKDSKNIINTDIEMENEYEYTGTAIMPDPVVSIGGNELKKGTDYEIYYYDNTNIGDEAYLIIAGIGEYHGSKKIEFTIKAHDISKATYDDIVVKYTGAALKPKPVLSYLESTLVENSDYVISGYSDNTSEGTGKIHITGKGTYAGTLDVGFIITNKIYSAQFKNNEYSLVSGRRVKLRYDVYPSGVTDTSGLKWTSSNGNVAKVTDNGIVETNEVGSATITLETSWGQKDSCVINVRKSNLEYGYKYMNRDMDALVDYIKKKGYTDSSGKKYISKSGTVTATSARGDYTDYIYYLEDEGLLLFKRTFITIYSSSSVSEITNVEMYYDAVSLKNEGQINATYLRTTKSQSVTTDFDSETYVDGMTLGSTGTFGNSSVNTCIKSAFAGWNLLVAEKSQNLGDDEITLLNLGNLGFLKYIDPIKNVIDASESKNIADGNMTLSDYWYVADGSAKCPEVTVKINSKTLVKDTDYSVSYQNNVRPGIATVTVTGKGDYTGTITQNFTIDGNEIYNNITTLVDRVKQESNSILSLPPATNGTNVTISYKSDKNLLRFSFSCDQDYQGSEYYHLLSFDYDLDKMNYTEYTYAMMDFSGTDASYLAVYNSKQKANIAACENGGDVSNITWERAYNKSDVDTQTFEKLLNRMGGTMLLGTDLLIRSKTDLTLNDIGFDSYKYDTDKGDSSKEDTNNDINENVIHSGTFGNNLKWEITASKKLIISGEGAIPDYLGSSSKRPWNGYKDEITELVIGDKITKIGSCAFSDFSKLQELTIPGNVKLIGDQAFGNCTGLKKVVMEVSVKYCGAKELV